MKTCTKCTRTLPLERFHTEMHRGKRRHKSRCVQCVQGEWAEYSAIKRGLAPPSEMALAFNGWRGPVNHESPLAWRVRV